MNYPRHGQQMLSIETVNALLKRLNTELSEHGLQFSLVDIDDNTVKLALRSPCVGCGHEVRPLERDVTAAFQRTFGPELTVAIA